MACHSPLCCCSPRITRSHHGIPMARDVRYQWLTPVVTHTGSHRLVADTGHFLSIPRIKKTIDGLSMLRLNVLHWRETRTASSCLYGMWI